MRQHPLLRAAAFTLLELLTVITIIAILAVIGAGVFSDMRTRADKVKCTANLKNLYAGAEAYRQDQGRWPQIDPALLSSRATEYYTQWIGALQPYGLGIQNWLCPTNQRMLGNPDMTNPKNVRIDYLPTPFDDKPMTPQRWPKQPWFIERGAVHEGGNLLIFTNGQVSTLKEAISSR